MSERVPRIRRTPLADDALIVVRGDDLVEGAAGPQAIEFRRRYPDWHRWGLSGFHARNETDIRLLAEDRLERFPMLRLYSMATLTTAKFEVVPTFRTPHVTIAFEGDLEDGLRRLWNADHETRSNPYHGAT